MAKRKETLSREIEEARQEWQKERSQRTLEIKEQDAADAKKRSREKEEYDYNLQRECQTVKDSFDKEKIGLQEEKDNFER